MNDDEKMKQEESLQAADSLEQDASQQPAASTEEKTGGKKKEKKAKKEGDGGESDLQRMVKEQAREDEQPHSTEFNLKKILGGEFLTARVLRDQIWLILLIVGFTIVYISNRYSCDKQRIRISRLTKELEEARFKAMSSNSDITEISRESNVLEMLRQNKDSVLHIPSQPPYIINVPEE